MNEPTILGSNVQSLSDLGVWILVYPASIIHSSSNDEFHTLFWPLAHPVILFRIFRIICTKVLGLSNLGESVLWKGVAIIVSMSVCKLLPYSFHDA
jgi:hypothetical protein